MCVVLMFLNNFDLDILIISRKESGCVYLTCGTLKVDAAIFI